MNIVATEAGGGNMEINKTDFHIPAARRLRDQLISLNQLAKGYALRGQGQGGISSGLQLVVFDYHFVYAACRIWPLPIHRYKASQ
jgi:hypothetical protein